MAFTTTVGAGGTSLIGTSGVDTTNFTPSALAAGIFIGAQGDDDVVNITNTSGTAAASYRANLGTGNDIINVTANTSSSAYRADDGNDTLTFTGTVTSSTISGLNGIDTISISGNTTTSLINGNSGNDAINFVASGGVNPTLSTSTIAGGQGNDVLTINTTGAITGSKINAQDGDDTVTVTAAGAMTSSTIFGGQGNDTLNASAATNSVTLSGDLGNDNVLGGGAADTLFGGDGADVLDGGANAIGDSFIGGAGLDRFNQSIIATAAGSTAVLSAVTTFTTSASTFDVISDFNAGAGGDQIDVTTAAGTFTAGFANNAFSAYATATTFVISGTLSADRTVFTVASSQTAGADTLVMTTNATNANFLTGVTNGYVLQGVNASQIVASNIV